MCMMKNRKCDRNFTSKLGNGILNSKRKEQKMKNEWIEIAKKASAYACSPYSCFQVGACLVTKQGKVYTGCNIENNGIQSICAERVAFVKALSEGEREFSAIAIVGKKREDTVFTETLPCGYCRQFMSEYCSKDFRILTEKAEYSLKDLLPYSFEWNG